jgi:PLAC8 family
MMQRGEIRKKYGLTGNGKIPDNTDLNQLLTLSLKGCTDCLCSCCCAPCDLAQQDKEVEYREGQRVGMVYVQPNKVENPMYYGVQ